MLFNTVKKIATEKMVERVLSDASAKSMFKARVAGDIVGKTIGCIIECAFNDARDERKKREAEEEEKKQQYYDETHLKDNELDIVWEITRPLSNDEKRNLITRVTTNGEKLGNVLKDMGVLKS